MALEKRIISTTIGTDLLDNASLELCTRRLFEHENQVSQFTDDEWVISLDHIAEFLSGETKLITRRITVVMK